MSSKLKENVAEKIRNVVSKANEESMTPFSLPIIQKGPSYMRLFESFVLPEEVLRLHGYVLEQLSVEMLESKKKCVNCSKPLRKAKTFKSLEKKKRKAEDDKKLQSQILHKSPPKPASIASIAPGADQLDCLTATLALVGTDDVEVYKNSTLATNSQKSDENKTPPEPVMLCKFHNGRYIHRSWDCCYQHKYSKGCTANQNHTARQYYQGELEHEWAYFVTPRPSSGFTRRAAVAIDCEMGGTKSNESELIRLSVIDYFTSEILINHLVYPDEPIDDYRTRYSGVSQNQMERARRNRDCLMGKNAAREALWRYVGPDTIIVGHSAYNDLNALRLIHYRVVDTMIIEKIYKEKKARETEKALSDLHDSRPSFGECNPNIVRNETQDISSKASEFKPSCEENLSLKKMTKIKLGRNIQVGRRGHDSVEDAIATRDLSHWNVVMKSMGYLS